MIVDLFSGCGGWDVGARMAGLPDPVGFELDEAACATRVAAGVPTVRADLTTFPTAHMRGKVTGLIASPPCQAFSLAGKGLGRDDPRGALVDVPLRWALDLEPEWIAWEQVPPVLPIWNEHAAVLERAGWLCWTGIVCAADFGVPQTRRRAILLARRDRRPVPPAPTHCETGGLFTARWTSMADALGWGRLKPSSALVSVHPGGGRHGLDGGSHIRATLRSEIEKGEWCYQRPATTLVSQFRPDIVAGPGFRHAGDGPRQDAPGSISITIRDALILQSFPPDFPVQGTRTAQFRQIGNAVPPLMAQRLLEAVA